MLAFGALLLVQSLLTIQIHAAPLSLRSLLSFPTRADAPCNGDPALCNRLYSNITFIGTHDSAFVGDLPTQNQEKSVTDQLNGGIRFMTAQTHMFAGMLMMCHTSCALEDSGLVEDYLSEVKAWMDNNPSDVVTLLLTNGDNVVMSTFDALFQKVGLAGYGFKPSTSPNPLAMSAWPTLGDMINSGQRLVTFIDYGADEKTVPYLLDEFNYYFETPYDTTDPTFNECKIDRANKVDADGKSSMYIVNHFLDTQLIDIGSLNVLVPDKKDAARTNSPTGSGSIGAQADLCQSLYGRYPNVVLIDFFGRGDPLTAQNTMNAQ